MLAGIQRALLIGAALAGVAGEAAGALSFNVAVSGWPNDAHRTAAVNMIQSSINRYNAYGDFGNYNVYVYYNAGIPTAQANYLGSIGFGGTYPNERVMMHELAHYLGSGTYGDPWDGARGEAMVDQFDGLEATLNGDSQHFWPYGLNYDSEGAEINKQRQVALVYAQRADMGIGATANPSPATVVNLTASDPIGESGFNYATRWSNNHFAQPGTAYSTGSFLLRTPASGNSFSFVGDSLTVNNTNGADGGLLYKGTGTTATTTLKNLILDGGYVRHASGAGDLFQLAGKVTLAASSTIDAFQGNIRISANIGGSGSLTKSGTYALTLSGDNSYSGDTNINGGTLRLAPTEAVASYSFDTPAGRTGVANGGTGGAAMNGALVGGAAIVDGGRFGKAVSLSGGASVDINSPIVDLGNTGNWSVSAWVKTTTPGASILTKGNGTGWANGNTIFYLGDGNGPGSGGIPSAVRYAGGFYQGSAGATAVNDDTWHQVTYVNAGGAYSMYVDGVVQPLSAGNNSFSVPDVGTVVRLGVSTNNVPADGTVNFNGLLDDVQFFNQALSAEQISAFFQGQSIAGSLPSTTNVTIASGATLDVNGVQQQIASLSGAVGSAVTLGAGRLTIDSAANSQFAGTISGAGGSLVKAGVGVLTLSAASTYSGATSVEAGTLRVSNTSGSGTGTGAVMVKSGATLAGVGIINTAATNASVIVESGGSLAPGASAGTLTFDLGTGSLDLSAVASGGLKFELGAPAAPGASDVVVLNTGTLNIGVLDFSDFQFADAGGVGVGSYTLFDASSDIVGSIGIAGGSIGVFAAKLIVDEASDDVLLTVTGVAGDYNGNGVVDAADYSVWRDRAGQAMTLSGENPNAATPGLVDQEDYDFWKLNFGQTSLEGMGAASVSSPSIPEPTAATLLLFAGLALCAISPRLHTRFDGAA